MTRPAIAFLTLGCKTNQAESASLAQMLAAKGCILVPPTEKADAYVLNTCAVTAVSDQKSRQLIRRVKRQHPDALIAVCGCFPQAHPEAFGADLEVDVIGGCHDRAFFVQALWQLLAGEKVSSTKTCLSRPAPVFEVLPAAKEPAKTRAWLKVQDGCDNACSYCIIPSLRGSARSLGIAKTLAQAGPLTHVREIVITGIEISAWGKEFGFALPDLAESLCRAFPHKRFRLGSLEPRVANADFCARLGRLRNLCPHFHIALQSGCDRTLTDMNRQYNTKSYAQTLARLRESFPHCALTTDIIVGFPGETDADFAETCQFVQSCRFSAMHIFPYSPRPGTPAAARPDQVPHAVKAARVKQLTALARRMTHEYVRSQVGRTLQVLFEADGFGHSENYLPVRAAGTRGQLRPVRITGTRGGEAVGVV